MTAFSAQTYKLGDFVRTTDWNTRYDPESILEVEYVASYKSGEQYIAFHDHLEAGGFPSHQFEKMEQNEHGVWVRAALPTFTVEISLKEYKELLDSDLWWQSCIENRVGDFYSFPDIVATFNQMSKL